MNFKLFILFFFVLLSVTCISPLLSKATTATSYTNVTVVEAKDMIDTNPSLVILDVRNQSEYDAGHIRNARQIPVWALAERLNELNESDTILVYCKSGYRSLMATQTLVNNSFANLYNMIGGITLWEAVGYPVYVNYSSAYAPYSSIQAAMNHANGGDTLYVSSGHYYEHLTVNKSIILMGENKDNTIIDGTDNGTIFDVAADSVSISDFTIQACGCSCRGYYGFYVERQHHDVNITDNNMNGQIGTLSDAIYVNSAQNVLIQNNIATSSNEPCILITDSSNILMLDNTIANSLEAGQIGNSTDVTFSGNNVTESYAGFNVTKCSNNTFSGNSFSLNSFGGISLRNSNNNTFFHNNFFDNPIEVSSSDSINSWDNGAEGNYWSSYMGTDANKDGIGDMPYSINANNTDHYPLMGAYNNFETSYGFRVDLISNSSISSIDFSLTNSSQAELKFNVTGQGGTQGFCRICIPKALINGSYVVTVDGENITEPQFTILSSSNEIYTYFYISYTHSQHMIKIAGTTTIPEFPTLMITAFIATCGLLAVAAYRRKRVLR